MRRRIRLLRQAERIVDDYRSIHAPISPEEQAMVDRWCKMLKVSMGGEEPVLPANATEEDVMVFNLSKSLKASMELELPKGVQA